MTLDEGLHKMRNEGELMWWMDDDDDTHAHEKRK